MNDSFKNLVEKCRKHEDPQIIQNASFEYAKVLVKNLLGIASEHEPGERVRLVTEELREDFYDELIPEITACFDKKSQVEIIVVNPSVNLEKNKFVQIVKEKKGHIYQLTTSLNLQNFIVIGDKRFRFEEDKENFVAIASFNNSRISAVLNSVFDEYLHSPIKQIA